MGMPITVEIADTNASPHILEEVFLYFKTVDEKFSPYKPESEISRFNKQLIENSSESFAEILTIAEKTKQETHGYFDIQKPDGGIDPSGIVKGWAINNAADLLRHCGCAHFFIEAGGDIQTSGKDADGNEWSVGIKNPFNTQEIVKVIYPRGHGVATSGSYERGSHIYNPLSPTDALDEIVSITVIGPNVLEDDRFATAAFAMGKKGVEFIEGLAGFEAYSIDKGGIATMTSNFHTYTS